MTSDESQRLAAALAAAREALAIDVPADHADRVAAAALAAPPPPARSWWSTAFPIAWRAAAVVDAAAIAVVVWLVLRAPPAERADPIDAILETETAAVLARALRLDAAPEVAP